jgi:PAS domain S-box-containing protein
VDDPYFIFYQTAMIVSLAASLLVAVKTWRHHRAHGSKAMIALASATFVWTLGFLLETYGKTIDRQMMFTNIGYLGSMSVPPAWFIFAINYSGEKRIITGWKIIPFTIIPLVTVILVWTNGSHELMWYNVHWIQSGPFTVIAKTYGTFFWIALAHNYLLVLAGAGILVRRLFIGTPLYTGQAVSLIVAVSLPLIWNIIYVFNLVPLPRKDLTPVMFAVSGIAIVFGLMRFRLFTVVPFARKFLIQQLRDGIMVFDADNRLIDINPAAAEILALNKYAVGRTAGNLSESFPTLEYVLSNESDVTEVPLSVSGRDRIYEVESIKMDSHNGSEVGTLVILRDITERKEMQEQLIAQDRLASIGELTSGVAHEINNPLGIIRGFLELLMKHDFPEDIRNDIDIINSEVDRAARIVANLLTFARKQPEEKIPVNINSIITTTLELRAYEQTSNNIRTVTHLSPDLPRVLGNELQLKQVLLNIIINAEYFMTEAHGKGILTITTERADNFVRISCKDDGPGIPPENSRRIFNPFFTTKEVGRGTGLGLSICHGIIAEHSGTIRVESTPGEGADFIIDLPVYRNGKPEEK